jgi:hypothetical protein
MGWRHRIQEFVLCLHFEIHRFVGADMMPAGCVRHPGSDFDSNFVGCEWDCTDDSDCFEGLADSNSAVVVAAAAAAAATVVAATAAAAYLFDRIPAGQSNLHGMHTRYQTPYPLEVNPP